MTLDEAAHNKNLEHGVVLKDGRIHCENCDYYTGDDPRTTHIGCMKLEKGIEHCTGCYLKVSSKRSGRQRLTIDIPENLHRNIKIMTIKRNCSITKYIMCILIKAINEEIERDKAQ